MKKFYYVVGAFVTAAAVFAFIAVMLKKLKISLSIEGIDDAIEDESENDDIELTIEKEPASEDDFSEDEDYLEKELDSMLSDDEPEIEVEITENTDGETDK